MDKLRSATLASIFSGIWVLILSIALALFAMKRMELHFEEHIDLHLKHDLLILRQSLIPDDGLQQLVKNEVIARHFIAAGDGFSVLGADGALLAGDPPLIAPPQSDTFQVDIQRSGRSFRVFGERLAVANQSLRLLVWRDSVEENNELNRFRWISFVAALLAGIAGALGVGFLVSRQFNSVDELNRQITQNDNALALQIITVPRTGIEAQGLAHSYNKVVIELREQVREIERFADHCAHELRTPIANLRLSIEADLAALEQGRSATSERRAASVENQLEIIDRLTVLINRLLSLGLARGAVEPSVVGLLQVVAAASEEFSPLIEEAGWTIENTVDEQYKILGHCGLLHQAFIDIFDNCLRHNPSAGKISISARFIDRAIEVTISNEATVNDELAAKSKMIVEQSSSEKLYGPGFGLGQPIIRRLIREMGGSVEWRKQVSGMSVILRLVPA